MQIPKLKAERLKRELTQVQLSYLSGVPVAEISKIENGRTGRPYEVHLRKLAKVLEVEKPELVKPVELSTTYVEVAKA